ncbi:hypothetical protein K435DRAFT_672297, partial [Dendrothele bispora CBS 962.96]
MIRQSDDIKGFHIPNIRETLKVTLFADDTTVYLSESDNFTSLEKILNTWCTVSTAKFNIEKTEILPLGMKTFRDHLVETRKMKPDHEPIPDNITIDADSISMQTLGGWVGNHADRNDPWIKVIDKIKQMFDKWEKSKPTFDGRILIIQYELTSRCQFTTATQGMPDNIIKILNKMINDFLWEGSVPRVKRETLQRPKDEGEKNLVNLDNLRDTIELIRLKAYLNAGSERPLWAYIADDMIKKAMNAESRQKFPNPKGATNIFLQEWNIKENKLPVYLRNMIKTGKKYDVSFETINPTQTVKESLPMW